MSLEGKLIQGDVILTCGRGFAGTSVFIKIANFFKRGYRERGWTHAAIYVGNGDVVEAFPKGIVRRSFKDAYLNDKFDLLVLRRKKIEQVALDRAVVYCVSAESKKYDLRALVYFLLYNFMPHGLHFILEKDFIGDCFNINDSYFCSELVATGMKEADAYCFEKEPYKVMPIDFYNGLWFDVIEKAVEPQKVSLWFHIKSGVFRLMYLLAAILFPFLLLLAAILVLIGVILAIKGLVALVVFLIALAGAKKKLEEDKDSKTKQSS